MTNTPIREAEKRKFRDILGCTCAYNEKYDGKSYNLKTEKYEDCECIEKIVQLEALLTKHTERAVAEAKHQTMIRELTWCLRNPRKSIVSRLEALKTQLEAKDERN